MPVGPFFSFALYLFAVIAFVGLVTGILLAGIWAIRSALGLETEPVNEDVYLSRAMRGFLAILGGMALGTLLVAAGVMGPLFLIALALRLAFGDQPPAAMATLGVAVLVLVGLIIAGTFAQWWQRRIWTRLPV